MNFLCSHNCKIPARYMKIPRMVLSLIGMIAIFLVNVVMTTALTTEKEVLLTLGKILKGHQWLLYGGTSKNLTYILARNGVLAASIEDDLSVLKTLPSICLCNDSDTFISLKEKVGFYPCIWIILKQFSEELVAEIPLYFGDIALFIYGIGEKVEVVSTYRVSPSNPLVIKRINVFNLNEAAARDITHLADKRRRLLSGSTLKVLRSHIKLCTDSNLDPYDIIRCLQLELISMMAELYGFRFDIVDLPPDSDPHFAYNFRNGSYSGLFLELQRHSVDLSTGSFVVLPDRLESFSFAWPTFHFRSAMFIKASFDDVSWSSYVEPLEPSVWAASATCFFITSLLLYIVATEQEKLRDKITRNRPIDAVDAIFSGWQILTFQGVSTMSMLTTFRIIYLSLLMFAVTMLPAYSATIISYLTIQHTKVPFTSLNQFLHEGSYTLNTLFDGFASSYLRLNTSAAMSKVLVPLGKAPVEDIDGFNRVCEGRNTYVSLSVGFQPGNSNYKCQIMELPITILVQYFGFGLPKYSPFKDHLSQGIHHLRSVGILQRMNKQINQVRTYSAKKPLTTVSVKEIAPLLVILAVGMVLSLVILLLEKVVQKNIDKSLKTIKSFWLNL